MSVKDQFRSIFKLYLFERLLIYFCIDKTYGSGLTKLAPNHYSYKDPTLRKVNRNGINYELNLANIVEWHLYFSFKETAKEKLFQLHPNPISILDIGANIGEVSLCFAQLYPQSKVYGFEPHPATFKKLKMNQAMNPFKNLHLFNLGLGAQKTEVYFEERMIGNPGMNRVTSDPKKSALTIQITTLDLFIQDNHIEVVSVIKMDVEGYEHEVLKGAKNTLSTHRPILFIELDDSNLKEQGSNSSDLIQFIESFGYTIEHAETGVPITTTSDLKQVHFDIICKPQN